MKKIEKTDEEKECEKKESERKRFWHNRISLLLLPLLYIVQIYLPLLTWMPLFRTNSHLSPRSVSAVERGGAARRTRPCAPALPSLGQQKDGAHVGTWAFHVFQGSVVFSVAGRQTVFSVLFIVDFSIYCFL